jgi:hypothetical protein
VRQGTHPTRLHGYTAYPDVSYRPALPFCRFFRRLVWRSDFSSPTARRTAFARPAAFAFVPPIRERLRAVAIFLLSLGIFASCRAVCRCSTIPPSYHIARDGVTVTVALPPVDAGSRARGPSRAGIHVVLGLAQAAAGGTDGVPLRLSSGDAQVNGSSIRMGTFRQASQNRALDHSQSVGTRVLSVFASPTAEAMGHSSETAADGVRVNGVDYGRHDERGGSARPGCCSSRNRAVAGRASQVYHAQAVRRLSQAWRTPDLGRI